MDNLTRIMLRNLAIAVVIVLLCAATAFAQDLRVGDVTKGVVTIPVCDTPEQVRDVLDHGKKGKQAMIARLAHYNRQLVNGVPACGIATSQIAILQVLWEEKVDGETVTAIVIMVPQGNIFIGLTTFPVLRGTPT